MAEMASNEVQILRYFTSVHFQVLCTFLSIYFCDDFLLLLRCIFNIDIGTYISQAGSLLYKFSFFFYLFMYVLFIYFCAVAVSVTR